MTDSRQSVIRRGHPGVGKKRTGNAPANLLTNHALDPYGKIPELKFCAARVEAI
jgi:hypothetical protein